MASTDPPPKHEEQQTPSASHDLWSEGVEVVKLLTQENTQLRAEITRLKVRLAELESGKG